MIVDLGTGDGRAVLARAATEPRSLVIGIDANAAAMAESSRRAARPTRKGGLPNALFVVAAAEAPPAGLIGVADLVTIVLPWGSLLAGVLGREPPVMAGIASLLRPGGMVEILLAPADRDVVDWPIDADDHLADAWRSLGLRPRSVEDVAVEDIRKLSSSWARRLGRPARRSVFAKDRDGG